MIRGSIVKGVDLKISFIPLHRLYGLSNKTRKTIIVVFYLKHLTIFLAILKDFCQCQLRMKFNVPRIQSSNKKGGKDKDLLMLFDT